jgi:phosphatidylglycerophosphatase C
MSARDRPVVAAFDVDGTLTTRDCVVPFLQRMSGRARLITRVAARPVALTGAVIRRDRDRFKAVAMRAAFAGKASAVVDALGATFAEHVHGSWLRPDTPKRLAWHQAEGHRIVLVSASLGTYLHPLGAMLGVDDVLCTEAVVGDDGRYTGAMVGANCRGPEKVRRLRSWMDEQGLAGATLWAYGDSPGDRELLAAADQAFLVKNIVLPPSPVGAS